MSLQYSSYAAFHRLWGTFQGDEEPYRGKTGFRVSQIFRYHFKGIFRIIVF